MNRATRPHRQNFNEPGDAHELTFSSYRGYQFLKAERTCNWLKESINAARLELDFDFWAYVFMPEHVHLILHPRRNEYDIAEIRQAIKEPVGRNAMKFLARHAPHWLPRLTRRRGRRRERLFWQSGGGYDRNIQTAKTLRAAIEYIHMNPVRRGLVERAVDWKWSSAAWYELGRGRRSNWMRFLQSGWMTDQGIRGRSQFTGASRGPSPFGNYIVMPEPGCVPTFSRLCPSHPSPVACPSRRALAPAAGPLSAADMCLVK
jgi:putative transposase